MRLFERKLVVVQGMMEEASAEAKRWVDERHQPFRADHAEELVVVM
jgi:hypothetical protein